MKRNHLAFGTFGFGSRLQNTDSSGLYVSHMSYIKIWVGGVLGGVGANLPNT